MMGILYDLDIQEWTFLLAIVWTWMFSKPDSQGNVFWRIMAMVVLAGVELDLQQYWLAKLRSAK